MEERAIERERSSRSSGLHEEIPNRGERRRRAARKPRRILSLGARLTLLGLTFIVLILATVGLVAKAIRPYHESSLQTHQLAQTRSQVAELDVENNAIRRRIAYLKTSEGIVTEARKAGYLKPGEIPFVVEGQTSLQTTPPLAAPTASVPAARPGRMRRIWLRLTGH